MHKSVLITPNHLFVLHMFENMFQDYLSRHLSRDQGEAG